MKNLAIKLTFTTALVLTASVLFSSCGKQKSKDQSAATSKSETLATVPANQDSIDNYVNPKGFVLLTDIVPDAILEIRYYSTYNFVGARIDGYEQPVALLTVEAANALKKVSDELKEKGYRLKIYDAYRPQRAVDHFVRWSKQPNDTLMKSYFYPMYSKPYLFDHGYISSHSGHTRGSTVDLTLFDMRTEKEVDMGGTFDWFGIESHPNYTQTLTDQQVANRKILRNAMLKHGFEPIGTEWWHFTLKNEPYPETYFNHPVRWSTK
ncbi:MAG: M15 family metallopeptidase [Bacteroidales bacterium]|nr:M15 family metallopeptidase [Bacteroidales bacterium]